jgi:hypothetical protein
MSLTSLIDTPDVRSTLKNCFPTQKNILPKLPLIAPRTKNYWLIGIAFDYIIRFVLQQKYPHAVDKPWIAELVVNHGQLGEISHQYGRDVAVQVKEAFNTAKQKVQEYRTTGVVTNNLFRSALLLAQIDPFFRAGKLPIPFGVIDPEDVEDLRALYEALPMDLFVSNKVCLLDPTFGASLLVGGADVDLVLDHCMIDIKTTMKLSIQREHYNQLIGYYLLSRIDGITGVPKGYEISSFGIYFSRYGYLHTWNIKDIAVEQTIIDAAAWLERRAEAGFEVPFDEDDGGEDDPEVQEYFRQTMERDD